MHRDEALSFADVVTFNLDEYYRWIQEDPLVPSVHVGEPFLAARYSPASVHIPRGDVRRDEVEAECQRYEEAIRVAGASTSSCWESDAPVTSDSTSRGRAQKAVPES